MTKKKEQKSYLGMGSVGSRFNKVISRARNFFKGFIAKSKFDMWKEIHDNDIANSSNPPKEARKWYIEYAKDGNNRIKTPKMESCFVYTFHYDNPKHEDILDFFDTEPLVICLGGYLTKDNRWIEVGINLHHLPPRVRRTALYLVFNLYKTKYTKNIYNKKPRSFQINWQVIKKDLDDLGVGFAVRAYIPKLRERTVHIKMEEWGKVAWLPSKKYSKKSAAEIEELWRKYVSTHRKGQLMGESHI